MKVWLVTGGKAGRDSQSPWEVAEMLLREVRKEVYEEGMAGRVG